MSSVQSKLRASLAAVAASAVSVGWSNYFVGNIERMFDVELADTFTKGLYAGGLVNLPAAIIAMLVTSLLVVGTRESATVNAFLVLIKVAALVLFVVLAIPVINGENFEPFAPNGFFDSGGLGIGIAGAAASIFFAYVGFDAVATAAEETKNPQRNIPIGLIGSLAICTVFYLLVAAGAVGSIGAQPVSDASGVPLSPGSEAFFAACAQPASRCRRWPTNRRPSAGSKSCCSIRNARSRRRSSSCPTARARRPTRGLRCRNRGRDELS